MWEHMERLYREYFKAYRRQGMIMAIMLGTVCILCVILQSWTGLWGVLGIGALWAVAEGSVGMFMARVFKEMRAIQPIQGEIVVESAARNATHETSVRKWLQFDEFYKYKLTDTKGQEYFLCIEREAGEEVFQALVGRKFKIWYLQESGFVIRLEAMIAEDEFASAQELGVYQGRIERLMQRYQMP